MKGTPTAPQCGFSNMVCRILDGHGMAAARVPRSGGEPRAHALTARACAGVAYASRNVLEDADLRQGIKSFTCAVAPLSPPQRVSRACHAPPPPQQLADHPAGVHRRRVCGASATLSYAVAAARCAELSARGVATAAPQGGSDILMSMHSSGELAQSLKKLKE